MSIVKRFRPSTESICSHIHCVENPCSIPCAHCSLIFCLRHLVEHQIIIDTEQKQLKSTIDTCRRQLRSIQFNDNRSILMEQLDRWVKTIQNNAERMKTEIDMSFYQSEEEFYALKDKLIHQEDVRKYSR